MQVLASKTQVRTPEQLAKAAMKQSAIREFEKAGLPTSATVTIEYMGERHILTATPTVKVDTGRVMFNFNANGAKKLLIADGLNFSVGGNLLTNQAIDDWQAIRARYGLSEVSAEDLDTGETTE